MAAGETVQITMPEMGESVSEGTVLTWLKKEGDWVDKDETVVEVSTDKVDAEIPSFFSQVSTVPSDTDSPISGMVICTVSPAAIRLGLA